MYENYNMYTIGTILEVNIRRKLYISYMVLFSKISRVDDLLNPNYSIVRIFWLFWLSNFFFSDISVVVEIAYILHVEFRPVEKYVTLRCQTYCYEFHVISPEDACTKQWNINESQFVNLTNGLNTITVYKHCDKI